MRSTIERREMERADWMFELQRDKEIAWLEANERKIEKNKRVKHLHFMRTGLDYCVYITRSIHGREYRPTASSTRRLFKVIHATKWERVRLTGNVEFAQMGVSCER